MDNLNAADLEPLHAVPLQNIFDAFFRVVKAKNEQEALSAALLSTRNEIKKSAYNLASTRLQAIVCSLYNCGILPICLPHHMGAAWYQQLRDGQVTAFELAMRRFRPFLSKLLKLKMQKIFGRRSATINYCARAITRKMLRRVEFSFPNTKKEKFSEEGISMIKEFVESLEEFLPKAQHVRSLLEDNLARNAIRFIPILWKLKVEFHLLGESIQLVPHSRFHTPFLTLNDTTIKCFTMHKKNEKIRQFVANNLITSKRFV